jgi:mannosyl-oligosaccharide alpha-1,2-mannosidase
MPEESEPLPGLVGTKLLVTDGTFSDRRGGWGGSGDSFYEYLLKMYLYDPSQFAQYRDRWVLAAESTMSHLASRPEDLPDTMLFVGKFANIRKIPESGHMECFAGGNFLLGGQILHDKKYIDFGLVRFR